MILNLIPLTSFPKYLDYWHVPLCLVYATLELRVLYAYYHYSCLKITLTSMEGERPGGHARDCTMTIYILCYASALSLKLH